MKLPAKDQLLSQRDVWVKSYEQSDVKYLGNADRYARKKFLIVTVLGINDTIPATTAQSYAENIKPEYLEVMRHGLWHYITMQCEVDKLVQPGQWIATEWKFTNDARAPTFPMNLIKENGL